MATFDHRQFEQELHASARSARTIRAYVSAVAHFEHWWEARQHTPFAPEQVTPADVKAYRDELFARQHYGAATVNLRLTALKVYFQLARAVGAIHESPSARVKMVAQTSAGPRWLERRTQLAVQRLAEQDASVVVNRPHHLWQMRDATVLLLLVNTGLRVAEVVALDVGDVQVKVRSGSVMVRGKGQKQREVPLNAEARQALARWLAVRPTPADSKALFLSQKRGRLSVRAIERAMVEYGHRAHLEHTLTPHQLRHTFSKRLVEQGVTLDCVATLLGHASLNTTRRYITPSAVDLERAVEVLSHE